MKTHLLSTTVAALSAAFLWLAPQTTANADLASGYPTIVFSDDFSSGTDALWTHFSAFAASTGQTWNAGTGAYEVTAPPNGYNAGKGAYGFVGSRVTSQSSGFVNGYVQADIVAWQGNTYYGAWGIGARLGNYNAMLNLTGYAFEYEPYGNNGLGDIRLTRFGPPDILNDLAAMNLTLTPGNKYTLTLETAGSTIIGSVWNQGQVGVGLVASISAVDSTYASGGVGLLAMSIQPMPTVDVTYDNFLVAVPEPATGALLVLGALGFLARRRVWRN